MRYDSEEEFLRNYDSSKFDKLSMTVDVLIFSVSDEVASNYRKLSNKKFSVLLVKRNDYPFKDKWCLPGGFIGIDEELEDAARRVLKKETNLENIYLEQLYTFGEVDRDPRMRIVSTSYLALIDKNKLNSKVSANVSWFDISISETDKEIEIYLDNGEERIRFVVSKKLRDMTTDRYDFVTTFNDKLAFDHPKVIVSGIFRLKNKIEYTDIVFNMMPEYFTLGELQQVYEVILGKKLLAPAFRRIIADKVYKTDKVKTGGGHRPSAMYKYRAKNSHL
ncbi:TPA: NUDIX domain-containing protein [Candidatus Avacholeplasma faecigallinarum]|nr:NUDIX domain-containing protein [Candidatus Avacholeplasma faecigallinarum]